jgi:hypothetical protein
MIKDLAETIYYCTITEAMEEKEEEKEQPKYYYNYNYMPPTEYYDTREMERNNGRMYYNSGGNSGGSNSGNSSSQGGGSRNYSESNDNRGNDARGGGTRGFVESEYPQIKLNMRDVREGKSPVSRRSYMESKEMHRDKSVKLKELETYMQELGHDITEMIQDASPEEKQLLQKKIAALATKIDV